MYTIYTEVVALNADILWLILNGAPYQSYKAYQDSWEDCFTDCEPRELLVPDIWYKK